MRGDTFDMVIFGGAGDLATRKLIPALYYLNKDGQIQGSSRILCTGRSAMDQAAMRDHAAGACRQYVRGSDLDDAALRAFLERLDYVKLSADDAGDFAQLADQLNRQDPDRCRVFFLATAPKLFATICEGLAGAGLNTPQARVVLELSLIHI